MMINVDEDSAPAADIGAGADHLTGVENKTDIERSLRLQGIDNGLCPRQETERCCHPVDIEGDDLLAHAAQSQSQGQRGSERITVRTFMGSDQKALMVLYHIKNRRYRRFAHLQYPSTGNRYGCRTRSRCHT